MRAHVNDGELAPTLGRHNHRVQDLAADGIQAQAVGASLLVHDLDEIGSLRDARVYERLRIGRGGDRRNRQAELRAMTLRRRDERAGGDDVCAAGRLPRSLFCAPLRRLAVIAEHVEARRHPKYERTIQRVAKAVRVRVDEAGQ